MTTSRPRVLARRQAAEKRMVASRTALAVRPLPAGVQLGTLGMSRRGGAKSAAAEPAEAAEKRAHPIEIGTSTL